MNTSDDTVNEHKQNGQDLNEDVQDRRRVNIVELVLGHRIRDIEVDERKNNGEEPGGEHRVLKVQQYEKDEKEQYQVGDERYVQLHFKFKI